MDDKILVQVKSILETTFKISSSEINLNSDFKDSLGLDSVDLMDAICLVEDQFKVKIINENSEAMKWPETVGELVGLIEEKRSLSKKN